jgi:hypothetical protein
LKQGQHILNVLLKLSIPPNKTPDISGFRTTEIWTSWRHQLAEIYLCVINEIRGWGVNCECKLNCRPRFKENKLVSNRPLSISEAAIYIQAINA